jgi:hypothetical protein
MNCFNKTLVTALVGLTVTVSASNVMATGSKGAAYKAETTGTEVTADVVANTEVTIVENTSGSEILDFNEKTHLMFMREEEKLARDVYTTLGTLYPESAIFGNIDDSEQRHTMAVKAMIEKYGYEDPNTNDNVGMYTGEDYGWYFTEKYNQLVERAQVSELEALYVGAFIEELDMMDINQCPKVIVETDNGINDVTECGKIYTDNPDIVKLYDSLLDGSDSHLEGYVKNIEKVIGEGNYQAQVLSQEEVNELLGR